jgi:hypothetical protein
MRRFFSVDAAASTLISSREGTLLDELLAWLRPQNTGLRTYKDFQQKVLQLGATDRNHLALYHILAMLASRFIESYEENPLPVDVADEAFKRLIGAVEKAARARKGSPSEQLTALNEIAATDLA